MTMAAKSIPISTREKLEAQEKEAWEKESPASASIAEEAPLSLRRGSKTIDFGLSDNESHYSHASYAHSGPTLFTHGTQPFSMIKFVDNILNLNTDLTNTLRTVLEVEDTNGRHFKVPAQFDKGPSSNFISRGTLDGLGSHKELPIPAPLIKTFQSPINPTGAVTPTHFVYVMMWNEELGFYDRAVKLKIIEVFDEYQVIIGRNTIAKHSTIVTKAPVFDQVEVIESDVVEQESSTNSNEAMVEDRALIRESLLYRRWYKAILTSYA